MQLGLVAFKSVLVVWLITWIALGVALILHWHSIPTYVSWPLALLEALLVPNSRLLRFVFGKE